MNTMLEILKVQQELLKGVVNTWSPEVNEKLLKLDELFERAELEQEIALQKISQLEELKEKKYHAYTNWPN